jgi:hypothetical protein
MTALKTDNVGQVFPRRGPISTPDLCLTTCHPLPFVSPGPFRLFRPFSPPTARPPPPLLTTRAYHANYKLVTKTFPRISILDLKRFPIRTINFDDPADVACHDKMVGLVECIMELHQKLAATIPADKKLYQRQIQATDRAIDALVYELYGLTEEEIAIVEGGQAEAK